MHLTPGELVDLAEGTRPEPSAPHLAKCEVCQRRLADLRDGIAMMAPDAAVGPVPEPSPLFWDRFQQRVSEAVAAETERRGGGLLRWLDFVRPRVLAPLSAAAAVAIVVFFMSVLQPRVPADVAAVSGDRGLASSSRLELLSDAMDDDPSLQLIADLTADVDWTSADAAGLAGRGDADHAVAHLGAEDLKELGRLLRLELGT
jgi:hypothetical protein